MTRPFPEKDRVIFRNVKKRFGTTWVLGDEDGGVDLTINRGQVVVVIGRSGSGKTTLLRCTAGLEQVNAGEIRVFGSRVHKPWMLKGQVGFVFQHFNLFPHKTALHNVSLALRKVRRFDRATARETARRSLALVGLEDKMDSMPSQLSGGQQQRVAIARSLAMDPALMLFDEVTSALDRELVGDVLGVMRHLAQGGMTMLIVTHELGFAESVADRVIFIDAGHVIEEGHPEQVLHEPEREETRRFLGLLGDTK